MTYTITFTGHGLAVGTLIVLAVICAISTVRSRYEAKRATHGTVAMANAWMMMITGFLTILFAGLASLVSQYG